MRRANPFLPIDDNLPEPIDEGTPGPITPPGLPSNPGVPVESAGTTVAPSIPNVGPVVNNLPNPATADTFVLPTQRTFGGNKQASGGWGDPRVGTGWTNITNFLSKGNIDYGRSLQGQPGPMDTSKGRSQRAGEMDNWLWNVGGKTPGSQDDLELNDAKPPPAPEQQQQGKNMWSHFGPYLENLGTVIGQSAQNAQNNPNAQSSTVKPYDPKNPKTRTPENRNNPEQKNPRYWTWG